MPYRYKLTWVRINGRGFWRKRRNGKSHYLKTPVGGKSDRAGYLASLQEWERLCLFLDGLGPSPYLAGQLKPDGEYRAELTRFEGNPVETLPTLVARFLEQRQRAVDARSLSLAQLAEDTLYLRTFQEWMGEREISAELLNRYRDHSQQESSSPVSLRKRLGTVAKFIRWLIDEGVIDHAPRDLATYARVENTKPTKVEVFTVEEVRELYRAASEPMKLYLLLALNAGFLQKDISSLQSAMIQGGILTRPRHKTGIPCEFKLWPITLEKLREQRAGDAPMLLNSHGLPLVTEKINGRGNLVRTDAIRLGFRRLTDKLGIKGRSFKHLRKTSADLIEQWDSSLTSLFLGHSEKAMKKAYALKPFSTILGQLGNLSRLRESSPWFRSSLAGPWFPASRSVPDAVVSNGHQHHIN